MWSKKTCINISLFKNSKWKMLAYGATATWSRLLLPGADPIWLEPESAPEPRTSGAGAIQKRAGSATFVLNLTPVFCATDRFLYLIQYLFFSWFVGHFNGQALSSSYISKNLLIFQTIWQRKLSTLVVKVKVSLLTTAFLLHKLPVPVHYILEIIIYFYK